MNTYLSCRIRKGQFGGERAVQGTTYTGDEFSLFVPLEYVERDEECAADKVDMGWLRLEVLATDARRALVRLPGQTFENGKTVTVSLEQITKRESREFARG